MNPDWTFLKILNSAREDHKVGKVIPSKMVTCDRVSSNSDTSLHQTTTVSFILPSVYTKPMKEPYQPD